MKKHMKKGIASLLTGAMLVSLCAAPAGAVYQDSQDHWAKEAIEVWSGHGVVQGDNGSFRPNDSITRGEMAAILVRLLGLTETDGTSFMDVAPDAWYADAIAKCAAAGIMKGDNGMARPNDPISRQEAMVMLGRALGIQEASRSEQTYLDGELVADWAAGYVNALTNRGIVSGVGENQLAPLSEINRASVVTILNNAVTNYVNQPGQTVTVSGDGITVVAASNVTVTGATTGDVLIAAGAAAGSVTLDGLKAEGSVVVTGAAASVTITGSASVSDLVVDSGADRAQVIVETDGKAGGITVSAPTATVIVKGEVTSVETTEDAAGTQITVTETGAVDQVAVSSDRTSVAVEGEVSKVTTEATGTDISGSGKVESVTAQAGASDVTVSTPKTDITVSASAGGSVTVNKAEVKPGESGTTNNRGGNVVIDKGDSSSISKPSSGSGDNEPDYTYYTVTFLDGENVVDTQRVREGRTVSKPADPVKEGYTFGGWYVGETVYNFESAVTGTLTLTAKWLANPQTITLVEGGHSIIYQTEYGSKLDRDVLNALIESGRPGEYVSGWFVDEYTTPYDFDTIVTGDLTLYYRMGAYNYTITYVIADATVSNRTVAYNAPLWLNNLPKCEEAGFTWTWYMDADFTQAADSMTMPAHDLTLYGQWSHDTSGLKGHGGENDPFLIGTAEDFANIYAVYTSDSKPSTTYYRLTDNITVSKVYTVSTYWSVVTPYLINSVFDGNHKTITVSDSVNDTSLFYSVKNATITDLDVELDYALCVWCGDTIFDDVDVAGSFEVGNNNGAYVIYASSGDSQESASTIDFVDCNADVTMMGEGGAANYNAVFVGYAYMGYQNLNFTNCTNEGTLVCGKATMFLGNVPGNTSHPTITVTNCSNNGLIQSTYMEQNWTYNHFVSSNPQFATICIGGQTYTGSDVSADRVEMTCGADGSFVHGPYDVSLLLTENNDGTFSITPADSKEVSYYLVSMSLYAKYLDQNGNLEGGTIVVSVSERVDADDITDDTYTTTLKHLSFVDEDWVNEKGSEITPTIEGDNTVYTVDNTSYYYIGSKSESFASLLGHPTMPTIISVSAYDESGNLLCSASLSN